MRSTDLFMYYDKFFPFYVAYANPALYDGERLQEKEFQLMKSYYPQTVRQIQQRVEAECERLDYEGSMLYDEYPDKYMLYHICSQIKEDLTQVQEEHRGFLDELIQVLLYQEISRRRCRRHRCRRYF